MGGGCNRTVNWPKHCFRRCVLYRTVLRDHFCKQLLIYRMFWNIFPNEKKIIFNNCFNCLIELSLSDLISGPVFEHVLNTLLPSKEGTSFWSILPWLQTFLPRGREINSQNSSLQHYQLVTRSFWVIFRCLSNIKKYCKHPRMTILIILWCNLEVNGCLLFCCG